jgi:AcrR family transcriptional regulator
MINAAYAVLVTSQDNRRGPKPKLSVDQITRVAIGLADAEGLAAVSMRRVGDLLGASGMSLYTYLPGKAELLDLMVDTVYAEVVTPDDEQAGWRARLEAVARRNWDLYLRHPWLLQVAPNRPVTGPHTMTKYEHELRAVAGSGLTDAETDLVIGVLTNYVHGSVRSTLEPVQADPASAFTFGLGLILDGLAGLIDRRAGD